MLENISWLGHASFRIISDLKIFIDPWKIKEDIKADLILITHNHHDHCSTKDIELLLNDNTLIIAPSDVAELIKREITRELNIKIVSPGDSFEIMGINIETIPAYNKNKDYHPKENKWLGYVIELDGERIYFAGDTDYIHEMRHLKNINIAFLPIGGTYTMDVKEAVKAALDIHPNYVVPMHYGDIIGEISEAEKFLSMIDQEDPTIEVVIMNPEYG